MADPPLLALKDIRLSLGDALLFAGVDLAIAPRDRICLLGRNGAGKSTLMKIIAGIVEADGGERFEQPGLKASFLPQEVDFGSHRRLADFVAEGLPPLEADAAHRVAAMLEEFGLDGDADPNRLSGGEARKAGLARLFIGEPDLMLLDEPTNHLDIANILALEERLRASRAAIVLVSHDRSFLRRVSKSCLWLDRGRLRRLDKSYEAFEDWRAGILAREAVETAKLDKLIAEETRWSHQGITARRARNEGRLRRLEALRAERRARIASPGVAVLETASASLSGRQVILAENISKSFGERKIVERFSTRILRGDRIGIIGPNGAGKTTLLRLLTGDLQPDSGKVTLGTNLVPLIVDQKRASLDPDATLWEILTDGEQDQIMVRGKPKHVASYLKDFLFSPAQARSPVRALSGGEKNRLVLAKAFARPSNLLILDEPTNDLDMETLDLLEDVLADYDGTVLLVSHDRDFLDRIVGSTIALEGDGCVREYAGGYSDWLVQRRATADAVRPSARTAPTARTPERKRGADTPRLGFRERHRLERLPREIAAIEKELLRLEAVLADPEAYNRDPGAYAAQGERHRKLKEAKAAKEEEWLELEMLREEIEGSSRP